MQLLSYNFISLHYSFTNVSVLSFYVISKSYLVKPHYEVFGNDRTFAPSKFHGDLKFRRCLPA